MDFFTVPTLTFGVLYCFFIIGHDRRKILRCNVTRNPHALWTVQQLREAWPYAPAHRFLLFDRDAKFGDGVVTSAKAMGSEPVRTAFRSPWQNGVAERWVGSCRRELLDHVIVLNERHLKRLMAEYVRYVGVLMPRLEDMVRGEKFDPARSQEVFRVAMSDHASMIVLPSLLASVRRAATHVRLEVSASGAETYGDVAAGRIDTFFCAEEAPPSLESEMLFSFDFVCLVGAALRVRARRLTLKQYLEFEHVLVELREGQQALVDRALSQLGAKRRVALTLPFFVPAIFAIAKTDLILTVPRRLAKITAVMAGVRVVEAPREIKSFPYFHGMASATHQ